MVIRVVSPPILLGARTKPLKAKPIPKKCSVACRRYDPITSPPEPDHHYTAREIRSLEMQYLGVWLSSSPFDVLSDIDGEHIYRASELESVDFFDEAITAGIIKGVYEKKDKRGGVFGIVSFNAQDGTLRAICFASEWERTGPSLKVGELALFRVSKNTRGYRIIEAQDLSWVD